MNISSSNNSKNVIDSSIKNEVENIKHKKFIVDYNGEYETLRGSLVLKSNLRNTRDGWTTYFINKDGSGRKIGAFTQENYDKGTFSSVYASAKEIYDLTRSTRFSQEDVSLLMKQATEIVKSKKK